MLEMNILRKLEEIKESLKLLKISSQEYLSLDEAAQYLKICKSTLYKHTSSGKLSFYRPNGKLIIFKKEDLDEFLNLKRIPCNNELIPQETNLKAGGIK